MKRRTKKETEKVRKDGSNENEKEKIEIINTND